MKRSAATGMMVSYLELKQFCWGFMKVSAKPYSFFFFFYQIVNFPKLGGRKEFQTSSRKSAAAGQATRRLVQPSIGVRLFVAQSLSAWGRAGGTSDHFHPPARRDTNRTVNSWRKGSRKTQAVLQVVHSSKFQCLGEHLALYSQVYLKSRSKRLPSARMKEGLERINGEAGPKIN